MPPPSFQEFLTVILEIKLVLKIEKKASPEAPKPEQVRTLDAGYATATD